MGPPPTLFPEPFIAAMRAVPRGDLLPTWGLAKLLLIELHEGLDHELTTHLRASLADATTLERLRKSAPREDTPHTLTFTRRSTFDANAPRLDPASLRARLDAAPHYVAPLIKRPDGPQRFPFKVLVGRDRNADIPLRHPTVSTSHAWFDVDADGNTLLHDLGSKNGSRVADVPLEPKRTVTVELGSSLRFGVVSGHLITLSLLIEALDP